MKDSHSLPLAPGPVCSYYSGGHICMGCSDWEEALQSKRKSPLLQSETGVQSKNCTSSSLANELCVCSGKSLS